MPFDDQVSVVLGIVLSLILAFVITRSRVVAKKQQIMAKGEEIADVFEHFVWDDLLDFDDELEEKIKIVTEPSLMWDRLRLLPKITVAIFPKGLRPYDPHGLEPRIFNLCDKFVSGQFLEEKYKFSFKVMDGKEASYALKMVNDKEESYVVNSR